jgi:hypothetical protein
MNQYCKDCPAPGCLGRTPGFEFFCEWAKSGDLTKIRHIINRSLIGQGKLPENPPPPAENARPPAQTTYVYKPCCG